jgi:hypothetical protein
MYPAKGSLLKGQAVGSAIRLDDRLDEHVESFTSTKSAARQNYGNTIGGIDSFTFGTIYLLPNYLLSFYALYPGYILTQGSTI